MHLSGVDVAVLYMWLFYIIDYYYVCIRGVTYVSINKECQILLTTMCIKCKGITQNLKQKLILPLWL